MEEKSFFYENLMYQILGFQATVEIASFSNISNSQIILEITRTEVTSYPVVPAPKLFWGVAVIDEANCCLHLEWTSLIYKVVCR